MAEMVRIGEVGAKEAREHPDKNIITRAVGAGEEVEADFFEVELKKDDHILICTDGLTNMVEDEKSAVLFCGMLPLRNAPDFL